MYDGLVYVPRAWTGSIANATMRNLENQSWSTPSGPMRRGCSSYLCILRSTLNDHSPMIGVVVRDVELRPLPSAT